MFDEVTPYYNLMQPIIGIGSMNGFDISIKSLCLSSKISTIRFDKAGANEWAFMFDMNVLFEQFVGKIVQSIEPTCHHSSRK